MPNDSTLTPSAASDEGAHRETIQLEVISQTPTPEKVKGLTDIVAMLKQIQAEAEAAQAAVSNIKAPTVPAGSTQGPGVKSAASGAAAKDAEEARLVSEHVARSTQGEAGAHHANAVAIDEEIAATQRLIGVQGELIKKTTVTKFNGPGLPEDTTTTRVEKLEPGVTLATTVRGIDVDTRREVLKEDLLAKQREELKAQRAEANQEISRIRRETSGRIEQARRGGNVGEIALAKAQQHEAFSQAFSKLAESTTDPVLSEEFKAKATASTLRMFDSVDRSNREIIAKRVNDVRKSFATSLQDAVGSGDKSRIASVRQQLERSLSSEYADLAKTTTHSGFRSRLETLSGKHAVEATKQGHVVSNIAQEQRDQSIDANADLQKKLHASRTAADQKRENDFQREKVAAEKLRAQQQKIFEDALADAHQQAQRITTHQQFQARIAQLEQQGYRLIENRSFQTIDGLTREERTWEKVRDGKRRIAKLRAEYESTPITGRASVGGISPPAPPRFVGGDFAMSDGPAPFGRGMGGRSVFGEFSHVQFARNIVHVTAWAAAVNVLYKGLAMVGYSLQRVTDIGGQTARLSQVFQGVGGTAQQLTDDVLRLAAATGRSSDEAMEAAIAWSRMGLNRTQVDEAVRVSLMAANVAEIDAGTATKQLSSIMAVYGLQIGQLNGVLGMLNQTSNTFNVTNRDLLDGVARSAAVAKQAGMSFAELQGIIGAAVGTTGQSGSQIGNAVKSLMVSLGNERVQEFLRGFKIEVTTDSGELKNASDILRDIFITYQKLNGEQRAALTTQIAGKTQATRFVAILQSYVQGQKLAIESQLNLNSAEQENGKITASLKSQLTGLKTEFERLAVGVANMPVFFDATGPVNVLQALSSLTREIRSAIALYGKLAEVAGPVMAALIPPAIRNAPLAFSVMNRLLEGPLESSLERYSDQADRAARATEGLLEKARLFKTAGEAIAAARTPEDRSAIANQIAPYAFPDKKKQKEFTAMTEAGDVSGAKRALEGPSTESFSKSRESAQKQLAWRQQSVQALDAEIERLKVKGGSEKEIVDREMQRNELLGVQVKLRMELSDLDEGVEGYATREQEIVSLVERQKILLDGISKIYDQLPGDSFTAQLEKQLGILHSQEALLKQEIGDLSSKPGMLAHETALKLDKELKEVRGKIAAVNAPENRTVAIELDKRAATLEFGKNLISQGAVGLDEADRLLNTKRLVEQIIANKSELRDIDGRILSEDEQTLIALQAVSEARLLDVKAAEMLVKLETDRTNAIMEQRREYMRSMALAGPADMLRKFAVAQIMRQQGGRMDLGQFFAAAPDVRREIQEVSPRFNPRIADMGRQIELLRSNRLTLGQQQEYGARLNATASGLISGPQVPAAITGATSAAPEPVSLAESFGTLRSNTDLLSKAFANLLGSVSLPSVPPAGPGTTPLPVGATTVGGAKPSQDSSVGVGVFGRPNAAVRAWNWGTTSLIPKDIQKRNRFNGEDLAKQTGMPRWIADSLAAAQNFKSSMVEGALSPLGLLTLPLTGVKATATTARIGLAGLSATQIPGGLAQIRRAYQTGDRQGVIEGVLGVGANVGITGGLAWSGLRPGATLPGVGPGEVPPIVPPRTPLGLPGFSEPPSSYICLAQRILQRAGVEESLAARFSKLKANEFSTPNLEVFRDSILREFQRSGLAAEGSIPRRSTNLEAWKAAGESNPEEMVRTAELENQRTVSDARARNSLRMDQLEASRRGLVTTGIGLAGLGLLTSSARADQGSPETRTVYLRRPGVSVQATQSPQEITAPRAEAKGNSMSKGSSNIEAKVSDFWQKRVKEGDELAAKALEDYAHRKAYEGLKPWMNTATPRQAYQSPVGLNLNVAGLSKEYRDAQESYRTTMAAARNTAFDQPADRFSDSVLSAAASLGIFRSNTMAASTALVEFTAKLASTLEGRMSRLEQSAKATSAPHAIDYSQFGVQ